MEIIGLIVALLAILGWILYFLEKHKPEKSDWAFRCKLGQDGKIEFTTCPRSVESFMKVYGFPSEEWAKILHEKAQDDAA